MREMTDEYFSSLKKRELLEKEIGALGKKMVDEVLRGDIDSAEKTNQEFLLKSKEFNSTWGS